MRFLILAVAASGSSVIDVTSSSAKVDVPSSQENIELPSSGEIEVPSPEEVGEPGSEAVDVPSPGKIRMHARRVEISHLTDLDPSFKVVGHYMMGPMDMVVLVRPDGSLMFMERQEDKYVQSQEGEMESVSEIFKHELETHKLVPMELNNHEILKTFEYAGSVFFGNLYYPSIHEALNNPLIGALMNPMIRAELLQGTTEWSEKGLVVFHDKQGWRTETLSMVSHDLSSVFLLSRAGEKSFSEIPEDEKRKQFILNEIQAGRIVPEQVGLHTIAARDGDAGYNVLSHDGARFVFAKSELTDAFLGPRLGISRRMLCHNAPDVEQSMTSSLREEYDLVAHFILNFEMAAQMVVVQKKADRSVALLMGEGDFGKPLLKVYPSSGEKQEEEDIFVGEAKKLVEAEGFSPQPWEDHTVYEWLELRKSFAIYTLSEPMATIVPMTVDEPAIRFITTAMGMADHEMKT